MTKKLSDEKIAKVREMRMKGCSWEVIRNEVGVSSFSIQKYCKDLTLDLRKEKPTIEPLKRQNPCKIYTFDELSEEDKERYNSCKPPSKNEKSKNYIYGKKGEYSQAAIFKDSKTGYVQGY